MASNIELWNACHTTTYENTLTETALEEAIRKINAMVVNVELLPSKLTMDLLKHNTAFTAPLEDVKNMWRVRFGSDWVTEADIIGAGDFYRFATHRLATCGVLEKYNLTGLDPAPVYRIINKE